MARIKLRRDYQRMYLQRVQRYMKRGTDRVRNRIERAPNRDQACDSEDSEAAASSEEKDEGNAAQRSSAAARGPGSRFL